MSAVSLCLKSGIACLIFKIPNMFSFIFMCLPQTFILCLFIFVELQSDVRDSFIKWLLWECRKLKMFPWTVCVPNVSLVSWFILYSLHGHTSFDINNYLTTQATRVLPCISSVNLGKTDDLFMIQSINRQIRALNMVRSFRQSFIALQSNKYLNK